MKSIRWLQGFRNQIIPPLPPLSKGGWGDLGFTLIEIVVVIVILAIVSAISIHFLISSLRVYTMSVNQKTLFDEGKLALERMCRDIRDARNIVRPTTGNSDDRIRFRRTNATVQDAADETIFFQLTGSTLEKNKASPNVTVTLAENVSAFTVTRGATDDEITIDLTLSLASGERVRLRTKVYPKNLADDVDYKNYFQNWQEELSS